MLFVEQVLGAAARPPEPPQKRVLAPLLLLLLPGLREGPLLERDGTTGGSTGSLIYFNFKFKQVKH